MKSLKYWLMACDHNYIFTECEIRFITRIINKISDRDVAFNVCVKLNLYLKYFFNIYYIYDKCHDYQFYYMENIEKIRIYKLKIDTCCMCLKIVHCIPLSCAHITCTRCYSNITDEKCPLCKKD